MFVPFIPVSNVSWDEAIACAKQLGTRVGDELNIPAYLYEKAANDKSRSNLSVIRAGEYEGFVEKIRDPAWKPDFGPSVFNERSGATAIGVRDFLVAYNVNLNTKAVRRANAVAFDVRENGRIKTGRWHAFRETCARCKRRTRSHSRHVEACEGDRVVCGGIWNRPSLDEPNEY